MSSAQAPQPAFKASIPGKVFVLGEYLALEGGPAIVGAIEPRFEFQIGAASAKAGKIEIHAKSPAGRWNARHSKSIDVFGSDPYSEIGCGGFGASTAQFLAVAAVESGDRSASALWNAYREATESDEGYAPSGLDLAAQAHGGLITASFSLKRGLEIKDHSKALARDSKFHFAVFSASHQADRKCKTHEHLEKISEALSPALLTKLDGVLHRAIDALNESQAGFFGRAMAQYAEALSEFGLETEAARADRRAFSELPGVLGVKGCGAGLSDAVLVLLQDTETWNWVSELARSRDLRCVAPRWLSASGAVFEGAPS